MFLLYQYISGCIKIAKRHKLKNKPYQKLYKAFKSWNTLLHHIVNHSLVTILVGAAVAVVSGGVGASVTADAVDDSTSATKALFFALFLTRRICR